jgi:hypothetical protein
MGKVNMIATYVTGTDTAKADRRLHEAIPFLATCPKCKHQRPQDGYIRGDLLKLLSDGDPVEAYCATCDDFWSLSRHERSRLATALGEGAAGAY